MIKNVKYVELNVSIATIFFNIETLKMTYRIQMFVL